MAEHPKRRKPTGIIQSLDRGLGLLEVLAAERRDVSLSELAARFSWDKSTTFRLLTTLVRRGYVDQDSERRKYRLGLKIFDLCYALRMQLDIRARARPFMEQLALNSRETCHLAVLDGGEIVAIEHVESPERIRACADIDPRGPSHCTALGKVLLAYLPDGQLEELLRRERLSAYTDKTITNPEVLRSHLMTVKEKGYALDDEESDPGLRCLAVPVHDSEGSAVAAVGISGPAHRIRFEYLDRYIELVKVAGEEISKSMGYVTDRPET